LGEHSRESGFRRLGPEGGLRLLAGACPWAGFSAPPPLDSIRPGARKVHAQSPFCVQHPAPGTESARGVRPYRLRGIDLLLTPPLGSIPPGARRVHAQSPFCVQHPAPATESARSAACGSTAPAAGTLLAGRAPSASCELTFIGVSPTLRGRRGDNGVLNWVAPSIDFYMVARMKPK